MNSAIDMKETHSNTQTDGRQESDASSARNMKAVVQDRYGSADVLSLGVVERPSPADDEVLVRVRAAGVDRGTWHLMEGLPYLIRLMGFGFSAPKMRVPGLDVSGVVEAVGKDVTRFAVGDEVFGVAKSGSFAESAIAKQTHLALKPEHLSFEEAASLTISAATALEAVREVAEVQEGQRVLVLGASGGVGTYAVQIARASGAEVTGVCSTSKMDMVRDLGARHVIDYTRTDVTASDERWDVILDIGGNRPVSRLRRILTKKGTLVLVGGEDGDRWVGGMHRTIGGVMCSAFVSQDIKMFYSDPAEKEIEALRELVEAGDVVPRIDRTFPLSEAAGAMRHIAEGRVRGKVVLTI